MPLHRREQKHKPAFLRKLIHGAVEMLLKFTSGGQVFCRSAPCRLRPKRFANFSALRGARSIDRETKRDTHQPGTKSPTVAQTFEPPVRTQKRFLRHVFRIRAVAQHATRNAIRQRPAFRKPLLELAAYSRLGGFLREFLFGGTPWLDQNQLLHSVFYASRRRSPSPYTCQTAQQVIWFTESKLLFCFCI